MRISTLGVGAAVTPTVIETWFSHYLHRAPLHQKPTAHISYHVGLQLIRQFLTYASHHTVEDLQAFTSQWVPSPHWVRTENVPIPESSIQDAAKHLTEQLGSDGIEAIGGATWWQWRREGAPLEAEWIEMRKDYNERKQNGKESRRCMLYVHGGAYFFGSVDEHRYQMQRHARKLQARVFAPRYRLAPQFPFPCGLLDCLAAYLHLLTLQPPETIVLAGDSAGGGMIVSMMVIMRDQGIPLPAGSILISPWVDLTHSFPSVGGDNPLDYIPSHGFHHKPSATWPPPNLDDLKQLQDSGRDVADERLPKIRISADEDEQPQEQSASAFKPEGKTLGGTDALSIILDDKPVKIKDQIQMYTTNALLAHPLVSPVMQPSLGGLPPMCVLTGGGEMLRDEQIYLAHKAAAPPQYPPNDEYLSSRPEARQELEKWPPTNVQLQIWDDICHVGPTLSFTRPAKFMFRSVAQFGAWVLARAQKRDIDIMDDDDISVISGESSSDETDSGSSHEKESATDKIRSRTTKSKKTTSSTMSRSSTSDTVESVDFVGRAGDPLPQFVNNMIRQRVTRHGEVYPCPPAESLSACMVPPSSVGVIKPTPVRRWLDAHDEWMAKYSKDMRSVLQERIEQIAATQGQGDGGAMVGAKQGEMPPPTALAGRRKQDLPPVPRRRRGRGLAVWSGWGSAHDEQTIERQQDLEKEEGKEPETQEVIPNTPAEQEQSGSSPKPPSGRRGRSQSNARMRSVSDQGQADPHLAAAIAAGGGAAGAAKSSENEKSEESFGVPLVAEKSAQRHAIGNKAFPFKLAAPLSGEVNPSTTTLNEVPGVIKEEDEGGESTPVVEDGNVFRDGEQRPEPNRFVTASEVPKS